MGIEQLVSAMDEAATQDIRMVELWPIIKQVARHTVDPQLQEAIAKLESWYAGRRAPARPHQHDIASPGTYQHNEAITIMDAWWPKLLEAEFRPALGDEAFARRAEHARLRRPVSRSASRRRPTSPTAGTATSARTCATCSPPTARARRRKRPTSALLRRRLARSLPAGAAEFAARSAVGHAGADLRPGRLRQKTPQASCFDMNRWTSASAISVPPFPFQNRPTFQQVVELTTKLPR